jgi:three-Cys-motif partner protein
MAIPDISNYRGREQAYVKHWLLERYLAPFAYKVGSKWDSIVYLDGFAGPWQVTDPEFADSSFAIAIQTLKHAQAGLSEKLRSLHMEAFLVEQNKDAFQKLETFSKKQNTVDFNVHPICGNFVDKIPEIERIVRLKCNNPFRFVFLDPKGWADIPMKKLQPFLKDRSCEVLINLMTRHIIRFLEEDDRSDSYQNLFGRPGVLEKLRGTTKDQNERAEQAVREYCRSLKDLCGFRYVSSAVILEPDQESVRYFLVYATNNVHGVEVFKQAEMTAARIQDEIRHETRLQKTRQEEMTFDEGPPKSRVSRVLRDKYTKRGRKKIVQVLKNTKDGSLISYEELFCVAMSFPLVTPDDLVNWIESWKPNIELKLINPTRHKKPAPDQDDQILVVNSGLIT